MRRLLIDTDTASDDAVALVMALRHPDVQVEAITVVAGNVPLPQAIQNALYTVDLCESTASVFAGAEGPLTRSLETAEFVHGMDGMGDIGLELSGRIPSDGKAVEAIVDAFGSAPGQISLVTLGPLTNIALALERRPELVAEIDHCFVMGGTGSGPGNITDKAEFNFWVDPEAAAVVLSSGMSITVIGWDISTTSAVFDPTRAARMRSIGTPFAEFAVDIQAQLDRYARQTGLAGFDLPDPIAMAVAIDPTIATTVPVSIEVHTEGDDRGWDEVKPGTTSSPRLVTHVPPTRFETILLATLA